MKQLRHGLALAGPAAALAGRDGVLEQSVKESGRNEAMLDFGARQHFAAKTAVLIVGIAAISPVDLDLVLQRALGGAIGFRASDQRDIQFARVNTVRHLACERLRTLAANGGVDQALRRRADITRQRAGQVCIVTMWVFGAAHRVLEDTHKGQRIDGRGVYSRIRDRSFRRCDSEAERGWRAIRTGRPVPFAHRLSDADQYRH